MEDLQPQGTDGLSGIIEIEVYIGFAQAMYELAQEMGVKASQFDYYAGLSEQMKYSSIAIVASFLCLESYINGYGATRLDPALWKACDRMPIDAKWLVIPKLATGLTFSRGHEPLQSFIWLRNLRNYAVHFVEKTFKMGFDTSAAHPPTQVLEPYQKFSAANAAKACDVVRSMIVSLHDFDNSKPPFWIIDSRLG
jgi:hypothetical protein